MTQEQNPSPRLRTAGADTRARPSWRAWRRRHLNLRVTVALVAIGSLIGPGVAAMIALVP
jgi:hypothetical protein